MQLTLPSRFNGPDGSANGGYTCGALAAHLNADGAEVTLRRPPPLDQPMELRRQHNEVELWHEEKMVAQARSLSELELDVPECPNLEQAEEAGRRYSGHRNHPFPRCFVCGPRRAPEDGLNIFAGPLADRPSVLAALWTPSANLAEDGVVDPRFLWCALDCPGAFAVDQQMETPRVLGRLTACIARPLQAGAPAIVLAWPLGEERRKAFAGTAVFGQGQELCAWAKAVWIAI